jgi:uncharacterized protein YycO
MTGIRAGHYVCVQTPGFLAAIVRKACKSPVDHAFIVIDNGLIVEARLTGVRIGELSEYAGHLAFANVAEPMSPADRDKVCAAAELMAARPYNYPAILELALGDLGWHWKLLIRLAGADHAFICSQLVALAGKAAGLDWDCGTLGGNDGQVTPAMLAQRPGAVPVTLT